MANESNYTRAAFLDHLIGAATWSDPGQLYIALLKTAPTASDDTSTNAAKEVETPASKGYDREAVTMTRAAYVASNSVAVTFGPADGDWSEAVGYWVTDALTGGDILGYGDLTANKTVEDTDSATFAIGEFTITFA